MLAWCVLVVCLLCLFVCYVLALGLLFIAVRFRVDRLLLVCCFCLLNLRVHLFSLLLVCSLLAACDLLVACCFRLFCLRCRACCLPCGRKLFAC